MKKKKTIQTYHHKNLKVEILRETLDYIKQNGFESLSLRDIAAKIGVAHTAIYHYYKNKNDLLAEVAALEFKNFVDAVKLKNESNREQPYAQLFNYGNMYIEYAKNHGNLFKLMLGKHPFDLTQYPELIKVSSEALDYLIELVKKCQMVGLVKKGDPMKIALGIWSISHGYATLILDNRIDTLSVYGFHVNFTAIELTEFIFDFLKNGLLVETKRFY